jgi:hypothetical protein
MNPTLASLAGLSRCIFTVMLLASNQLAAAFEAPTDPCSLFTMEQVSSALEMKATPGKHVVPTLCEWDAGAKKLTVGFLSASAWEQTKALRQSMKSIARTPISGLGEEAEFTVTPVTNTLQVKKGGAVLDIHLYGFTPDQAKAKAIALAQSALDKF